MLLPDSASIALSGDLSVEMWTRPQSLAEPNAHIVTCRSGVGVPAIALGLHPRTLNSALRLATPDDYVDLGNGIALAEA